MNLRRLIASVVLCLLMAAPAFADQYIRVGIMAGGGSEVSSADKPVSVRTMTLEEYTARVITREMQNDWPMEAMKAQAIVSRTYAYTAKKRHPGKNFDVCNLTHCQLLSLDEIGSRAIEAAAATKGMVLTIGGQAMPTAFSSTCGGVTADGVYIGMPDWMKSVKDGEKGKEYCKDSPHFEWETRLSPAELALLFEMETDRKGRATIKIQSRDTGGRAVSIQGQGSVNKPLNAYRFLLRSGSTLGWNRVKSCLFEVSVSNGLTVLKGRGLGHGVGMCQWGARGRALAGQDYKQILKAYFPRAVIGRL